MKRRGAEPAFSGTASRRSTASEGRELVGAWQASGLPVSQFCRDRGIAVHRVHYWKRRLLGGASASGARAQQGETPEFFAVDLGSIEADRARAEERDDSLSVWVGRDVRIEVSGSVPRETFMRALRWTVEAMRP